jgi:hypothetical protein
MSDFLDACRVITREGYTPVKTPITARSSVCVLQGETPNE